MSYGEFYTLLKKLPGATEGLKEELVYQFTGGRTTSLRQMTIAEYRRMCASLRESDRGGSMSEEVFRVEIKRRRSAVLKRMQKLGVDTTDWAHVDNFCMSSKIAGKRFARLSVDELHDLVKKLESMLKKQVQKNTLTDLMKIDKNQLN